MRGGILGRASGFWKGCWGKMWVGQSPAFGFVCVALFFFKAVNPPKLFSVTGACWLSQCEMGRTGESVGKGHLWLIKYSFSLQ